MVDLLSIAEAQRRILERVRPRPAEAVPLDQASGRILAEPVRARVDLPPFASSAMDGYAVRAVDTPGELTVTAQVAAGRPVTAALGEGEAIGIATGGVVPAGADAVVPIEHVLDRGGDKVEVPETAAVGANIRPRGGDVHAGDEIVAAGSRVNAPQLGAAAAAGIPQVLCAARPRAAVLPTGTELRSPGSPLRPGEVYEANGVILASELAAAGAVVDRMTPVGDDEGAHREALARALEADVVVTSGGVSVGPHDLVRAVEAALGVEEVFWRVAVKPGKPISFGVHGDTLVFGLPGNPVSVLVGFQLFVRPAVLAMQGARDPLPRFERGLLTATRRRSPERDELVRARMHFAGDGVHLDPLGGQESHMIGRAAAAEALVYVPRGEGTIGDGEVVDYLRLA